GHSRHPICSDVEGVMVGNRAWRPGRSGRAARAMTRRAGMVEPTDQARSLAGGQAGAEVQDPPAARRRFGAEVGPGEGVRFRVGAAKRRAVGVVLEAGPGAGETVALAAESDGDFAGIASRAAPGTRYRFELGGRGGQRLPDPASRY